MKLDDRNASEFHLETSLKERKRDNFLFENTTLRNFLRIYEITNSLH